MKKSGKCPKCGSSTLIQEAPVVSHEGPGADHPVDIRVDQKPSAVFMKWPVRSNLDAYVCSQCGYTELYARDPESLRRAFLESQQPPTR